MITVDLSKNPKQYEYFIEVNKAIAGLTPYRKFWYGGAIRGGKTFITLFILARLCARFPGFKAHILRNDFPNLQATTIPSLGKILHNSPNWGWNRDKSNFFAYHRKTDAKLFFKPENIQRDPDLKDFLGLETNAFFLEQAEELAQKTLNICISRVGSWYIDPMPPGLIFGSFNPTQKWVKDEIYLKWRNAELPADTFFQTALPSDNAFVTTDQWTNWGTMDERYQKQFIEGDWTDFDATDNRFAYCFEPAKHMGTVELSATRAPLILSFDFNVDPITCLVAQHTQGELRGKEQIQLANSDIYKLCEYIKVKYGNNLMACLVTGDASGQNRSALTKDNQNYYQIIKKELGLSWNQFKVPKVNPPLEENRVLVNAVLHRYSVILDKEGCKPLEHDLMNVRVLPDGGIDKTDKKLTHCLDCFRYICNTFLTFILKK